MCRLSPVIRTRWNSCIGMLHIILSQGVSRVSGVTFQLILKRLMHTVVKQMVVPSNLTLPAPLSLTDTEENVVRYVAGYVVMKLKKKYRKHHHQYASVLDTMKTSLDEYESVITSIHDYSRTWTEQRDRGGLITSMTSSSLSPKQLNWCVGGILISEQTHQMTCYPR